MWVESIWITIQVGGVHTGGKSASLKGHIIWWSERSHSQVMKIEICDIILLYPKEDQGSNDTLGNTPFQLISDFFHVNQGV